MLTGFVDKNFPKWVKILMVIFGGAPVVYRVLLFVDSCIDHDGKKNVQPLVIAIIAEALWPFYLICFIIDLVDVCHNKKIRWLCNIDDEMPRPETKTEDAPKETIEVEIVDNPNQK